MGQDWKNRYRERIKQIAPQLAAIMEESASPFTWGDYIIEVRDLMYDDLLQRGLTFINPKEHMGLKDLWRILLSDYDRRKE